MGIENSVVSLVGSKTNAFGLLILVMVWCPQDTVIVYGLFYDF